MDRNIPLDITHSLPPTVILDYVYGIAAYMQWRSTKDDNDDIHSIMESYRQEHYMDIPVPHELPDNGSDGGDAPDDPNDPDYIPHDDSEGQDDTCDHPHPDPLQSNRYVSVTRGDRMSKAMDDLNLLLMSVEGITPQEAADRREKRMEEEELRAQETGRRKVTEWMDTSSADGL